MKKEQKKNKKNEKKFFSKADRFYALAYTNYLK